MADGSHAIVSALAGVATPGRYGRSTASAGVTACEVRWPGLATMTARNGRSAELLDAARSAFGVELPVAPKRIEGRDIAFVWSGPDQWLACTHPAPSQGMEALLATPFAGLASIVDQSHGRTLLRLTGPRIRDALAKGVPIDLHPRAFKARRCRRHSCLSYRCPPLADRRPADLRICGGPQLGGKLLALVGGVGCSIRAGVHSVALSQSRTGPTWTAVSQIARPAGAGPSRARRRARRSSCPRR